MSSVWGDVASAYAMVGGSVAICDPELRLVRESSIECEENQSRHEHASRALPRARIFVWTEASAGLILVPTKSDADWFCEPVSKPGDKNEDHRKLLLICGRVQMREQDDQKHAWNDVAANKPFHGVRPVLRAVH